MIRLWVISLLLFCSACAQERHSPQANGISYEVVVRQGSESDRLPMLIALHYMGGSPESSREDYTNIDISARILLLAGPYPIDDGYSWFPDGYYELDAITQTQIIIDTAQALAVFIEEVVKTYDTQGRPIITGYSQGADLAHILALHHAEQISAIIPMGAQFHDAWVEQTLSTNLLPENIMLFHGQADDVVSIEHANAAHTYYSQRNTNVSLEIFENVGHAYPPKMKKAFEQVAIQLLKQQSKLDG